MKARVALENDGKFASNVESRGVTLPSMLLKVIARCGNSGGNAFHYACIEQRSRLAA
jgi:hypothetical protein